MDESTSLQSSRTPKSNSKSQPSSTNSSTSGAPASRASRSSPANAPTAAAPPTVSRPPLNVYLKMAVVRSPDDAVLCEDPERPGKTKRVAVGSLTDRKLQDAAKPRAPAQHARKEGGKKTEIPVPTITTVKTYARDVPPTYELPRSYIRYNRASYEEVDEAVEYTIDEEDEDWWTADEDFGPNSIPRIVWEGSKKTKADSDETLSKLTVRDVILQNPKYLMSPHGTDWLVRRHRPRLPLSVFERMMDRLEKATAFETIVTVTQAEKILVQSIPLLKQIFANRPPVIEKTKFDVPSSVRSASKSAKEAKRIPAFAPPATLSAAVQKVYDHWVQKRCKLRRPLLRRFWPVTSTSDLNPHMVFRPRDKEKRKLRKKRQNDLDSYKKMKMLKADFERAKTLCDLILRREGVTSLTVDLTNEYYRRRMHEWLDASGVPWESGVLDRELMERVLDVPKYFEDGPIVKTSKGKKRKRSVALGGSVLEVDHSAAASNVGEANSAAASTDAEEAKEPLVVAGHDGGLPAPSFLDPLPSRESLATNWDEEVPFVPYCENGKRVVTTGFKHRPRLGRGGRIVIDRIPFQSTSVPPRVVTYGSGMAVSGYHTSTLGADGQGFNINEAPKPNSRSNSKDAPKAPAATSLEDILPPSLGNPTALSRRIEEICAMGVMEDYQLAVEQQQQHKVVLGNDNHEVLVPVEDFLDAPPDFYGKEQFVIGPL